MLEKEMESPRSSRPISTPGIDLILIAIAWVLSTFLVSAFALPRCMCGEVMVDTGYDGLRALLAVLVGNAILGQLFIWSIVANFLPGVIRRRGIRPADVWVASLSWIKALMYIGVVILPSIVFGMYMVWLGTRHAMRPGSHLAVPLWFCFAFAAVWIGWSLLVLLLWEWRVLRKMKRTQSHLFDPQVYAEQATEAGTPD